jgi:uncharacterized membrane protein YgdD (TMEM256/DUF423 family)
MNKKFLTAGALLAAVAVILGAFGAHYLKKIVTPESLQTFETGVRYHFYHAFALLAAGILYEAFASKFLKWAGNFFLAGIVLFSGSLYLLCLQPAWRWLGPVTPLGGLCFILGWIFLALAVTKKN